MLENLKSTELSGKYIVKTNPTWLPNTRGVLLVCDAIDKHTSSKATIIFLNPASGYPQKLIFQLVRQDNQLHFLQGGVHIAREGNFHYLILEDVNDAPLVKLETNVVGFESSIEKEDHKDEDKLGEVQYLDDKPFSATPVSKLLIIALVVIGVLVVAVLVLLAINPPPPPPTPTITPTFTPAITPSFSPTPPTVIP